MIIPSSISSFLLILLIFLRVSILGFGTKPLVNFFIIYITSKFVLFCTHDKIKELETATEKDNEREIKANDLLKNKHNVSKKLEEVKGHLSHFNRFHSFFPVLQQGPAVNQAHVFYRQFEIQ